MTSLSLESLLLLCSALLTSGCSLALALQKRRLKKELTCCRAELTRKADVEESNSEPQQPAVEFSDSLLQATLMQRLQNGSERRQPPDKYRYAAALAEQGMDAKGIASVLQFPLEEAIQLIALKRAAQSQKNQAADS